MKINAHERKIGTWSYQYHMNFDKDGFTYAHPVTPGKTHENRT